MASKNRIGLPKVPEGFFEDTLTAGPNLPNGWEGDAWTKYLGPNSARFFLRAWNKKKGQATSAESDKYEAARAMLLERISTGQSGRAGITTNESRD